MSSRVRWRRGVVLGAALALAAGCQHATGPGPTQLALDVARHRDQWAARRLTSYQYDYLVTGYFINYANRHIRLAVRDGVVQSATYVATGEPLPGPPAQWPTIDSLFARASEAAAAGVLRGVRFDPALGYPTKIDLAGPPDASGSLFASGLQPVR